MSIDRSPLPVSINGIRYNNFREALRQKGLMAFFTDRQRRALRKEVREKGRVVRTIKGGKYTFRALAA